MKLLNKVNQRSFYKLASQLKTVKNVDPENFKSHITCLMAIILMTIFCSTSILAQPNLPSNPPQAPIDGGLALLAIAGGGYAINKIRQQKKDS